MKTLELVRGDPEDAKDGASYSRFVIPFSYQRAPHASVGVQKSEFCYKYVADTYCGSKDEDHRWRREYLTRETEAILFENAKWFRLHQFRDGKDDIGPEFRPKFTIQVNGKKIAASLSAPLLVLFECPPDNPSGKSEMSGDILQVGFLVVEIFFADHQKEAVMLDDLLKINELFRYFGSPFKAHYEDRELGNFLQPDPFELSLTKSGDQKLDLEGDENRYYGRWWQLVDEVSIDGKWKIERATYTEHPVTDCVPNRPETATEQIEAKTRTAEHVVTATEPARNTYPDNRAFVWTCAILPLGAEHLWQTLTKEHWKASHYGHWIKLLNVDYPGDKTTDELRRTTAFEREWAEKHTHHRWEELGTYYGFTPHSGAALAPRFDDPPIWQHFRQMYFDQVLLLLYVRVVLFRFSARLAEISRDARNSGRATETWIEGFQHLRWQFTLFTNLYQFPLLSNQQQGVELYSLARECMEIDDLVREVQEQIHNSHDYLAQQLEQNQTRQIVSLTSEAAIQTHQMLSLTSEGAILTKRITFLTRFAVYISVVALSLALFGLSPFIDSPLLRYLTGKVGRFTLLSVFVVGLVIAAWFYLWRKEELFKEDTNE